MVELGVLEYCRSNDTQAWMYFECRSQKRAIVVDMNVCVLWVLLPPRLRYYGTNGGLLFFQISAGADTVLDAEHVRARKFVSVPIQSSYSKYR